MSKLLACKPTAIALGELADGCVQNNMRIWHCASAATDAEMEECCGVCSGLTWVTLRAWQLSISVNA